jgi:NTE family protein
MSRRVGLVLGGGGVLGGAWLAGALVAVQEALPVPIGEVDLVVGTSVGSIMAVALRSGLGVDGIVAHQRGLPVAALPGLEDIDRDAGSRPPLPRMRIGSPRLLAATARAPRRVHPRVAASALAPQGRGRLPSLSTLVAALVAGNGDPGPGQTWIMAVDYETGRRVAFGRPGAPPAPLPDAVVASCSIPGWHQPATIGGRRYVDGGVRSTTSLDQVARAGLDEVYVLAPMASYRMDRPSGAVRLERMFRWMITRGLTAEVRQAEAAGVEVRVLTPGPEDLAAIGANLMNPARRPRVLETSLRTSRAALASAWGGHLAA